MTSINWDKLNFGITINGYDEFCPALNNLECECWM